MQSLVQGAQLRAPGGPEPTSAGLQDLNLIPHGDGNPGSDQETRPRCHPPCAGRWWTDGWPEHPGPAWARPALRPRPRRRRGPPIGCRFHGYAAVVPASRHVAPEPLQLTGGHVRGGGRDKGRAAGARPREAGRPGREAPGPGGGSPRRLLCFGGKTQPSLLPGKLGERLSAIPRLASSRSPGRGRLVSPGSSGFLLTPRAPSRP